MTHVTSAFQKNGSRGEQRSPEVKNSENGSKFKLLLKWINCISKDALDVSFLKKWSPGH